VAHYSTGEAVPVEAPHELPDSKPPMEWPAFGAVSFKDVRLAYRPGLPDVLKGISMEVKAGERVGIVGRYVVIFDQCSGCQ
jgi:ATP-binding cassette, subfamily C (CFTR/MRP), member 1